MWTFIPENKDSAIQAPWFEDARSDFAPYYSSSTTLKSAQTQVIAEMGKLSAAVVNFQSGKFEVNKRQRFGYMIEFLLGGATGRIQVAGLPIRSYTPAKEARVRVQCLLNVRDWLKCAVTMQVFSPDTSPLLPYLLVTDTDGQQHTVADYILSKGQLPMLAAPDKSVVVDAVVEPI